MFVLQLWFLLVIFVISHGKEVMGIIQDFLSSPLKPNIFFHSNSVLEILLFRGMREPTEVSPESSLKALRITSGHSSIHLHY